MMAIDWKKRLTRLKALDPENVNLKAWRDLGIDTSRHYQVTLGDGDTLRTIINNFAATFGIDVQEMELEFEFDYYDDITTVFVNYRCQIDATELRKMLDAEISKIERTIKRAEAQAKKGPTKKQLREQEERQKRDAALAKLSAEDLKVLGIRR